MELLELKANIRTTTGNSPARALRREGRMPAILYGPDQDAAMLSVNVKDLETLLKKTKSSQMLLNLVIENGEKAGHTVMLKELQTHPISRSFLHADFYEVAMDRKIKVMVPVTTKGNAIGVEMGGMLQIIRRELEVLCYPNDIPEVIELDITELNTGDSIHIEDISIEGVEFPADVNFTVLTILAAKAKEIEEELEEGEELEGAEEGETAEAAEQE